MSRIFPLRHGGIMVNYRCTAACRHCLYACSPTRGTADYLSRERAREICRLLKKGRAGSAHIGGGEPFLDFEGLLAVVEELGRAGIRLDYIETNGFWAKDRDAAQKIEALKMARVEALCISLDPFHAEYVPYGFPLALAKHCAKAGLGFFLWKREFLPVLSPLDGGRSYGREELEKALAPDYVRDTARRYGIHFGGRAVNIEEEYGNLLPAASFFDGRPCAGLFSTEHFHVDNEGFFIPPGCTGLRLPLEEAIEGIDAEKYPVFTILGEKGVAALVEFARKRGFSPAERYVSKCGLCFGAREYLAQNGAAAYQELDAGHYIESRKYYRGTA